MFSIVVLGFIVWARRMFTVVLGIDTRAYFTVATIVIVIPTGINVFSRLATLWIGTQDARAPTAFAIGLIFLCTVGGVAGVVLTNSGIDLMLHGTYITLSLIFTMFYP